jgi:hypothetical protein
MYKIQIGFEDGYYVAYLAKHEEGYLSADVIDEIENVDIEELINDIPYEWKVLLTNFLGN